MLFARLHPRLDRQQHECQVGFRPNRSVDDTFVVFEEICTKTWEYGKSLWVVSLDLTKSFDRIEHPMLFAALRVQGVPHEYLRLLADVYVSQTGQVQDSDFFDITCGVK